MSAELQGIADRALEYIHDGDIVGLGTGRAATTFIETLGRKVQAGLQIRGIPTSNASAEVARRLNIPLVTFEEVEWIDVTIDGADEVDPQLNLIKGLGGALVREKIVAAASRKLVILVGGEKVTDRLGRRGVLPLEVVPFAAAFVQRKLVQFGWPGKLRERDGKTFITDNGGYVIDAQIPPLSDPASVEHTLGCLPGIVGTGLFLEMAHVVLVQRGAHVDVMERSSAATG